jgi:hypothetical protein
MWAYLRHYRIFEVAALFNAVASLPGRSWARWNSLPRMHPDTSDRAIQALADAISDYFKQTQARGHRCTVEHYRKGTHLYHFFAYPDDYTDTFIGHGDDGNFVKRPQKRAFEIVIIFDAEEGTLDLFAVGDRGVKNSLAYIFSCKILKQNLPAEVSCDRAYELNGLLSREFNLSTDPKDGIESVRVRSLRLSLGSSGRKITLDASPRGTDQEVYDMIDDFLQPDRLTPGAVNVTHASFQFRLTPTGGKRAKAFTFEVGFPNTSNLKSLSEEAKLLGEKYLKVWGIDRG